MKARRARWRLLLVHTDLTLARPVAGGGRSRRISDVGHHDVERRRPGTSGSTAARTWLPDLRHRHPPPAAQLHRHPSVADPDAGHPAAGQVGRDRAERPAVQIVDARARSHGGGDGVDVDAVDQLRPGCEASGVGS